jgi:putative sterol carrier protein
MAAFNVPENVTVDQFFKDYVPQQFKDLTSGADLSFLTGKEFSLQFNVDGKIFCIRVKDGKDVEVVEGGINNPMLAISVAESDWRDTVTGKLEGVMDQFTDPSQAADATRYNALQSTKGTMNVELKKSDGSLFPFSLAFNGSAQPSVKIMLAIEDWIAMQKKEVAGPSLFMNGKMKFEGDMAFLMNLQRLI